MSDKSNTTVAQKITRLGELTAWFESDSFVLEEAVDRFKEAEILASEIEKDLLALKNEIVVLKQKFDEQ